VRPLFEHREVGAIARRLIALPAQQRHSGRRIPRLNPWWACLRAERPQRPVGELPEEQDVPNAMASDGPAARRYLLTPACPERLQIREHEPMKAEF
jgi:hypothetical protein